MNTLRWDVSVSGIQISNDKESLNCVHCIEWAEFGTQVILKPIAPYKDMV